MITAPLSPIPPVGLLAEAAKTGSLEIDYSENFVKQSFRNRYYILTANGLLGLTVPTRSQGMEKRPTAEIEIAYDKPWQQVHLRAIIAAYGNSPFFEHYFPNIETLIAGDHPTLGLLFDHCWELWRKLLKIPIEIVPITDFQPETKNMDWRIRGKTPADFGTLHKPQPYIQVFNDRFPFAGNLSIIDLLMNLGPQSGAHLLKQAE